MQAPVAVVSINPMNSRPLSCPANDPLVTHTTAVVGWEPAAAIGGVPQMSIVLSEAISAFTIRCHIARTPADLAAAAPVNCLTLNFQDATWSRILTAVRDGGLAATPPRTLRDLHEYIRGIASPAGQQDPFQLHAQDWNLLPAWAPGAPAARQALAKIRFLSLAPLLSLEATSGPFAGTAPWTYIARLVGAFGPVGTQAARTQEASYVQAAAAIIRNHSVSSEDGSIALHLRSLMQRTSLPSQLMAHHASPEEQSEELSDSFSYKTTDLDRLAVEQKRFDLTIPW